MIEAEERAGGGAAKLIGKGQAGAVLLDLGGLVAVDVVGERFEHLKRKDALREAAQQIVLLPRGVLIGVAAFVFVIDLTQGGVLATALQSGRMNGVPFGCCGGTPE